MAIAEGPVLEMPEAAAALSQREAAGAPVGEPGPPDTLDLLLDR